MDPNANTTDLTGGSILSGSVAQSAPGQAGSIIVNADANGNATSVSFASGPAFTLTGIDGTKITDQGLLSSNASAIGAIMSADGSSVQQLTLSNTSLLAAADIAKAVMAADQDPAHPLAFLMQSYSYSGFGVWSKLDFNSGLRQVGVFASGAETPVASMPKSGTATYAGNVAGFASVANPNYQKGEANAYQSLAVTGAASLTANFLPETIAAQFTGLTTQRMDGTGAAGSLPDLSGNGGINGNSYTITNLSGGGLTGTANGKFYGSAAQETAGTFQASGNGTTVIAAFGASQGGPSATGSAGAANMTANFAQGTVASGGTLTPPSGTPITGSSSISGNTFSSNPSGGGLTGSSNGSFNGPAANQTSGTLQAPGGGTTPVGAFGSKK